MKATTLEGGEQIICHPPAVCEGQTCCVHNPSDHHMRDWPQHWRSDTLVMERLCPHGIGHPDPDDLAFLMTQPRFGMAGIHGCDGCCAPSVKTWKCPGCGWLVSDIEYTSIVFDAPCGGCGKRNFSSFLARK